MKRKLGVIIAVILTVALLTSTVAFAAGGDKVGDAINKLQARLEFLNKIKPHIEQMAANKEQLVSLRAQLKEQQKLSKTHIADLKKNLSSLTADQLTALQNVTAQIKETRTALKATNDPMVAARQALRAARKARNYDDYLAAFNTVNGLQQTRIEKITKLIDLNKQIQAI